MRDRGSKGQGIESCLRHDFFHIAICLQTDSNPSRSKGENISDQSSLEVSKGHGKKRVKGSIPAQRHRKKEAYYNAHISENNEAKRLVLSSFESS